MGDILPEYPVPEFTVRIRNHTPTETTLRKPSCGRERSPTQTMVSTRSTSLFTRCTSLPTSPGRCEWAKMEFDKPVEDQGEDEVTDDMKRKKKTRTPWWRFGRTTIRGQHRSHLVCKIHTGTSFFIASYAVML